MRYRLKELRIKFISTHISYERHAGMRKMNSDESHVYSIYVGRQFLCERVFVQVCYFMKIFKKQYTPHKNMYNSNKKNK